MAKFVFDRVENIVGKGENDGYQHFLLFPQCFIKLSSLITKISALSKLIAFADVKFNVIQNIKFSFHNAEGSLGKGENSSYQHFLLSQNVFKGFIL